MSLKHQGTVLLRLALPLLKDFHLPGDLLLQRPQAVFKAQCVRNGDPLSGPFTKQAICLRIPLFGFIYPFLLLPDLPERLGVFILPSLQHLLPVIQHAVQSKSKPFHGSLPPYSSPRIRARSSS